MKSMVLLIDTNVVIDYICERRPQYETASCVIASCQKKNISGYIAFHSLPTIWYILRKLPAARRRRLLLETTRLLAVTGASHDAVVHAIQNEAFSDFEDCLQEQCALQVDADYIVTENTRHFANSAIPAVTSAEMLQILYDRKNILQ